MAKTYTLTEAADGLGADAKTLRRWIKLENWDLTAQTSKYDERVKWLTEEQVKKLATAHERPWPPKPKTTQEQAEAAGLTGAVNRLRDYYDGLELSFDTLAAKVEQLERQLKELQDWKTAQESKPRPGRKPKADQGETPAQGED